MFNVLHSKGSVIVNFFLVLKTYHTTTDLTETFKTYLQHHDNELGLFAIDVNSVRFAGKLTHTTVRSGQRLDNVSAIITISSYNMQYVLKYALYIILIR